jgi:uncharacterized damage-inducible protein DinB
MTEIDRITRLLQKTFDGQPWYGSSIMEILKTVSADIASDPMGTAHSIGNLVEHMISWRTFATRRLLGDAEFEIDDQTNFPSFSDWAQTMQRLEQSQQALLQAIKQFPNERLNELVPSNRFRYTFYTLLHGIIQHDIYHLGQIAILKKLISAKKV